MLTRVLSASPIRSDHETFMKIILSNTQIIFQNQKKLNVLISLSILLVTIILYAFLMVSDGVPLIGLILLAVIWLLHAFASGSKNFLTPMHPLILAILILLPINLLISASPQLTLVKAYGLILSFSLFFVIIRLVQFRKDIPFLIVALLALSFGAALLGLFATEFPEGGIGFVSRISQKLPQISAILPGASINKNTMGGALTFFPPLLLSLIWDRNALKRLLSKYPQVKNFPGWLYKTALVSILGLVLLVLLLTQSRGAWLGTAVGLFVFLVWKDKRFLIAIPIGLIFLFLLVKQTGDGTLLGFLSLLDQGQDSSLPGRVEIWAKVISLIKDFPATGIGLDALGQVYPIYFNSFLFPEYSSTLFHAHNTLLSVAIEMGLPTLILYVSLLTSFGVMTRRAWKHARSINRVLIMGLVCGMLSHQVFGVMDAFTLGKNLGVTMWIYYAILAALFIHQHQMINSKPPQDNPETTLPGKVQIRYLLLGLASWIVFTLIVLTFCQKNIYISLLLSLFLGILLGWFLMKRFIYLSSITNISKQNQVATYD